MNTSTTVNNSSTQDLIPAYVRERPISFLATAGVTICGQVIAHTGVFTLMTDGLAFAIGGIFLSIAVIQWVGMGRYDACVRAGAHKLAGEVKTQAIGLGTIEAAIYAISLLVLGGFTDPLAAPALAMGAAGATGAFFAYLNFRMKYVSVDPIIADKPKFSRSADAILQERYDNPPANIFDLTAEIQRRAAGEVDALNFLTDKVATKERIRARRRRNAKAS